MTKHYRSKDGESLFTFRFVSDGDRIDVYCLRHPPLGEQDPSPTKTHLFPSGRLCFAAGSEPRDQRRAEALARQWAEYFLEYSRTGVAQY